MNQNTQDQPTRRHNGGGQRLAHGVRLTFYGALSAVEEWLEDECRGDYRVVIVGIGDDLASKTIEVLFEEESDKEKFKDNVRKF